MLTNRWYLTHLKKALMTQGSVHRVSEGQRWSLAILIVQGRNLFWRNLVPRKPPLCGVHYFIWLFQNLNSKSKTILDRISDCTIIRKRRKPWRIHEDTILWKSVEVSGIPIFLCSLKSQRCYLKKQTVGIKLIITSTKIKLCLLSNICST